MLAPILIFLDWKKTFHMPINASFVTLGMVLVKLGEHNVYHPSAFDKFKLYDMNKNYTTTKREGLAMVYALQKFRYYLLGAHFKLFTNHSILHYLSKKPLLWEIICCWLIPFQEFDF